MTLTKNSKSLHISPISVFRLFISVYDVTLVEIKFNHSKLCNFTSSWKMVKNTIKLYYRKRFLHKSNKNVRKTRGDMFYAFVGMASHAPNTKLCNSVTSWNLTKSPQNFVQCSFSIELTRIWHKNKGKSLASFPL